MKKLSVILLLLAAYACVSETIEAQTVSAVSQYAPTVQARTANEPATTTTQTVKKTQTTTTTSTVPVRDLPSSSTTVTTTTTNTSSVPTRIHERTTTDMTYADIRNDKYYYLMRDIRPEFLRFLQYDTTYTQNKTITEERVPVTTTTTTTTTTTSKSDSSSDSSFAKGYVKTAATNTGSYFEEPFKKPQFQIVFNDYRGKSKVKTVIPD